MNLWFVCYLLGCIDLFGWLLMATNVGGWRVGVVVLAGFASSIVVAVAVPWYIVCYLQASAMLPY